MYTYDDVMRSFAWLCTGMPIECLVLCRKMGMFVVIIIVALMYESVGVCTFIICSAWYIHLVCLFFVQDIYFVHVDRLFFLLSMFMLFVHN